jgi:phage/plasmid-associated DNA primase
MVPLIGVRLGICQEIDKDSTLNGALIKSLSAGDPFKCRGAFEKLETENVPFCKLVLCVNPLPKFDADDQAIVDRARYVPFEARFVDDPDPSNPKEYLADKTFAEETMTSQAERNNFFSWLITGALGFYKDDMKLKTPQLVVAAKKKNVAANDVVSEFLSECCITTEKSVFDTFGKREKKNWMIGIGTLNSKFTQWMEDNGDTAPKRGFLAKRLETLGYTKKKSEGFFIYSRIQLIPENQGDDSDSDEDE